MSNMFPTEEERQDETKKFLEKMYKEIASIDDEVKRLEQTQRAESMIAKYNGDDRIVLSPEYLVKVEEERGKNVERIMSNIPTLDGATKGFKKGEVVVISAPTGTGKTTFCQTLMENFFKNNIMSLFFSYEVSPEELVFKTGVVYALPAQLNGDSLEWLEKKIIESKVKFNTKAVFIDHLHYLSDVTNLKRGQNMSGAIGDVMKKLTLIAKQWDVCIFLVSHLTKTKFDEMPTMSDLRDSSFTAQYAGVVLMMLRVMEPKRVGNKEYATMSDNTTVAIHKCRGVDRHTDIFSLIFKNGELVEPVSEKKEVAKQLPYNQPRRAYE